MLRIEKTVLPSPEQWEIIIEGMRNPMNSWEKSDSVFYNEDDPDNADYFRLGEADHDLMERLAKGGSVHAKYRRMIPVYLTLTAPLYWFKEFDTYKVGTVCNSCSTMHKIHSKEFTLEDFSTDKLYPHMSEFFEETISFLNYFRYKFNETKEKGYWEQIIQLLPSSYNQKRTVMLNYEVLSNIYHSRQGHKLNEWHTFCEWIEGLPYAELITNKEDK